MVDKNNLIKLDMKHFMTLIHAEQISKHYIAGERKIHVLKDITLSVKSGEFVAIRGSSGSGKSTLLMILSGLDAPSSGSLFFEGRNITHATERELALLRNLHIGFIFQSFHLIPSLTALENVIFPAQIRKDPNAGERGKKLLIRLGLDHRSDHLPHQLSGGEKQRIAISRALINSPRVIFADEPTGNLDSENGDNVFELLLDLKKEYESALILVSHNESICQRADRTLRLQNSVLVRD